MIISQGGERDFRDKSIYDISYLKIPLDRPPLTTDPQHPAETAEQIIVQTYWACSGRFAGGAVPEADEGRRNHRG